MLKPETFQFDSINIDWIQLNSIRLHSNLISFQLYQIEDLCRYVPKLKTETIPSTWNNKTNQNLNLNLTNYTNMILCQLKCTISIKKRRHQETQLYYFTTKYTCIPYCAPMTSNKRVRKFTHNHQTSIKHFNFMPIYFQLIHARRNGYFQILRFSRSMFASNIRKHSMYFTTWFDCMRTITINTILVILVPLFKLHKGVKLPLSSKLFFW